MVRDDVNPIGREEFWARTAGCFLVGSNTCGLVG